MIEVSSLCRVNPMYTFWQVQTLKELVLLTRRPILISPLARPITFCSLQDDALSFLSPSTERKKTLHFNLGQHQPVHSSHPQQLYLKTQKTEIARDCVYKNHSCAKSLIPESELSSVFRASLRFRVMRVHLAGSRWPAPARSSLGGWLSACVRLSCGELSL